MSAPGTTTVLHPGRAAAAHEFRQRCLVNGFRPIRVRTDSKHPLGKQWQHGESKEQLLDVKQDALNTGVLAAGLLCFDVDVDAPEIAAAIKKEIQARIPGALIRMRANSPRFAAVGRAANGEPGKRSIAGQLGKLEMLGAGQQFLADGVHPSGAAIEWENERSPATVPRNRLPAVTECQIDELLTACAPLLGSTNAATRPAPALGIFEQPFVPSPTVMNSTGPVENELGAGIEPLKWFDGGLNPQEKSALVQACLNAIDNRVVDPRELWLRMLFAAADAGLHGCPDAEQLAREWSRRGRGWTSDADFDRAWHSWKSGKVQVGSLISAAKAGGFDVAPWRNLALSRLSPQRVQTLGHPQTPARSRAKPVSALPAIPEHRKWLFGNWAMRSAITMLVSPGGRGKSSLAASAALSCASGRPLLDIQVHGGPLNVLFASAEETTTELARKFRGGMQRHQLKDKDVPGLHVIGAEAWGLPLLRTQGGAAILDERGWEALRYELGASQADMLILDPFLYFLGGVDVNDNAAATVLMGGLVGLAAEFGIAILIAHHAAKNRDATTADSAMGAASFINFSRSAFTIEPLAEKDAGHLGVPAWEARGIFRVLGVKQNYSAPNQSDQWFQIVTETLPNADPPLYPNGDKVGVVVSFRPGVSGPTYPPAMIRDALHVIDNANPPLSPSKRATGRYAGDAIAQAIAPHRAGKVSDTEAATVLDHIIRSGLAAVQRVKIARAGGRADERNGLVVTIQGKAAMQPDPSRAASPTLPQSPQQSRGNNAGLQDGRGPKGPRNVPRGCGGDAGEKNTGTSTATSNDNKSKTACDHLAAGSAPAAPDTTATIFDSPAIVPAAENDVVNAAPAPAPMSSAGAPPTQPVADERHRASPAPAPVAPSNHQSAPPDDLSIPDFLKR